MLSFFNYLYDISMVIFSMFMISNCLCVWLVGFICYLCCFSDFYSFYWFIFSSLFLKFYSFDFFLSIMGISTTTNWISKVIDSNFKFIMFTFNFFTIFNKIWLYFIFMGIFF